MGCFLFRNGSLGLYYLEEYYDYVQEIYDLHIQLLHTYEKYGENQGLYQREIKHFKRQLFMLHQLIKIHERSREQLVKWCSRIILPLGKYLLY